MTKRKMPTCRACQVESEQRAQYEKDIREALEAYSEGDYDPETGSYGGDQAFAALQVRDEQMEKLTAQVSEMRELLAAVRHHTDEAAAKRLTVFQAMRAVMETMQSWSGPPIGDLLHDTPECAARNAPAKAAR